MGQSAPLPYSEQGDRQPFDAAEWAKAVAGAVGILVVIVAAFIAVRHGLTLSYDKRGNGCQSLTGASAWTLELALLVPRLALVAWCGLTAAALRFGQRVSAARPASGEDPRGFVARCGASCSRSCSPGATR